MAISELTQLITDRDNIRRAIRSGVFQCSVDSQATTFANMRDMRSVEHDLDRQISRLAGVAERKPRVTSFLMNRGV
jgi:hypothetical protein